MTVTRLVSTTQRYSRESRERGQLLPGEMYRRVEAGEGVEGDRQRSLRQELDTVSPVAPEPADAQALVHAQELAAQLLALGDQADKLLQPALPSPQQPAIDDLA
jgi:hypothetical protein